MTSLNIKLAFLTEMLLLLKLGSLYLLQMLLQKPPSFVQPIAMSKGFRRFCKVTCVHIKRFEKKFEDKSRPDEEYRQ